MAEFDYYSALSGSAVENIHCYDASALSYAFSSDLPELGPERQLEPQQVAGPSTNLIGRELYSKEQWEAQKSVVWRLYNVENKPYKRVVEILRTEHNFYPTRRQFYRKIDEWGFKKNIKDSEMRDIAQNLNYGVSELSDAVLELRSQRVDPAKIQRWQKKYKLATKIKGLLPNNNSMTGDTLNASKSNTIALNPTDPPFGTSASDSLDLSASKQQVVPEIPIPDDGKVPLSYWPFVDVPGSPNLSRLFEALKIECSEEIPPLSIDSPITASVKQYLLDTEMGQGYCDESNDDMVENGLIETAGSLGRAVMIHPRSAQTIIPSKLAVQKQSFSEWTLSKWDFSCGQPLSVGMNLGPTKMLSPLPITEPAPSRTFSDFRDYQPFNQGISREMRVLQWKNKWLRLRRVWGAADPRTLETQHALAFQYREIGKYEQAESLFRRIASCLRDSRGFKCSDTLRAYLDVIELVDLQGRHLEAAKIHHQVHGTILSIVSPEDELCLQSTRLMASRLYLLDHDEEACQMQRQLLQIRLSTLGLRCGETLAAIQELAMSLFHLGKILECEELLDIIMQLQRAVRNIWDQDRVSIMYSMTWALRKQGRLQESTKLAMALLEQSTTLLGRNHYYTIGCLYLAATSLLDQSRLEEGEALLREALDDQDKCIEHSHIFGIYTMEVVAFHLATTGRHEEAAKYYEVVIRKRMANCGVEHSHTIDACARLGLCYEKLSRYEEAFSLYQDMVYQLGGVVGEEHPATQKVHGWIIRLEDILANQRENMSDGGEESGSGEEPNSGGEESDNGEESAEDAQLDAALGFNDVANVEGGKSKVVYEDEGQEEEWMESLFDFQKMQGDANSHYE